MYKTSAEIYDAIYHFKDYAAAAIRLRSLIRDGVSGAASILDVACGTGKHIQHLRSDFNIEGIDLSEDMLEVARRRCPDVQFHRADMTQFDLGRQFDVVMCLFSAIAYVRTVDRLQSAVAQMAVHLRPGGMLIVEPWISPERYRIGDLVANYVNDPDLKISWMYVQEADVNVSVFNIHYQVGTREGITHFAEKHEMGLFTHEQYCSAFERCNLSVSYDPTGLFGRGLYIGTRHGA